MMKSKQQQRAEAVKRLRTGESDNLEWLVLGDDCPSWVNYDTLSYNKAVRNRIADLLIDVDLTVRNEASDDELFRCSYCHCRVYNIDMTEGDCGYGFTFCPQCGGEVDESDSRRIEAELLNDKPTNGTDSETNGITDGTNGITLVDVDVLDLMRTAADELHAVDFVRLSVNASDTSNMFGKLADMIERDYVSRKTYNKAAEIWQAACNEWRERATEAEAERDEWKTKCDTREVAYKQADAERERYSEQIDELRAERDEWKAKAELYERERDEFAEGQDYWHDKYDELAEGQSKVRAGQSNLEWLYEHAPSKLAKVISEGAVSCDWCLEDKVNNCSCECARGHLAWLMSEHVDDSGQIADMSEKEPDCVRSEPEMSAMDAQRDTNGTCPDINGTASDAHSKAQSKTEPTLSEQSESLSDANDGKAYADVRERSMESDSHSMTPESGSESESDSREKAACQPMQDLMDECAEYERIVDRLTAERDQWRSLCGELMDAADALKHIADTRMIQIGAHDE